MSDSPILTNISYHAFNSDRSQVAICPNNQLIYIYTTGGSEDSSKWLKKHTLDEHAGLVSGIDWSPVTNLIVTCSHDRNAYVWRYDDKSQTWKPTLVILRINRAATSVKWSPQGNKFAVTSGAKCVPVCHFEESNDWWISRMIKKHKSTVVSLAWSPNNKFIITGSTDMKCRVFSAFMEGIDSEESDKYSQIFPDANEFGEVLAEFDSSHAWVNAVAWSPGGYRLAFATHASTIHFIQLAVGKDPAVQTLFVKDLPYLDIVFASENSLVAAGFEPNIDAYSASGSESSPTWSFKDKIDKKSTAVESSNKAMDIFKAAANKGAAFGSVIKSNESITRHKNIIVNITWNGKRLSTAGMDGRVCFWDIPK